MSDILNHDEFVKGKGSFEHDIDLYENTIEALSEALNIKMQGGWYVPKTNEEKKAGGLLSLFKYHPKISRLRDEGWIDDD